MKRIYPYYLSVLVLFATLALSSTRSTAQFAVTLPGSFQSEMGCPGDWQPECTNTALTFNTGTGNWEGTFLVPAGDHEYKVAYNYSWAENYGLGGEYFGPNIPLSLATATSITFIYNPVTHIVSTGPPPPPFIATLVGSFQSELGCPGDWQPDCSNTILTFDIYSGQRIGYFPLPAGNWEFKVTEGQSWAVNYGVAGVPNGPNYSLFLAEPALVLFSYNITTHLLTATPVNVVIPGTFQSELGCAPTPSYTEGDWNPACHETQLVYDPVAVSFSGTFLIPEGHSEFKVALFDDWAVNYGTDGLRNGPNFMLDLPVAMNVKFTFDPYTHLVTLEYPDNAICATVFYDANVNGFNDEGSPMQDVKMSLEGNGNVIQYTGADGKTCFTGLSQGAYMLSEELPAGYYATTQTMHSILLGPPQTVYIGNVCLGSGGAKGIGFWMSKQGQELLEQSGWLEYMLMDLRYMNLRNANGGHFDPFSYAELRDWMQKANAKNMAYMLSAQMVALKLSLFTGLESWTAILHVPGYGNMGYNEDFMYVWSLLNKADLHLMSDGYTTAGHPNREFQAGLKNIMEMANNNSPIYVQAQACSGQTQPITKATLPSALNRLEATTGLIIYPNPTYNRFSLRPTKSISNEAVQLAVYDVAGKLIYRQNGTANKEYRFGESFAPGIYLLELRQGTTRKSFKLVKQ